MRTRTGRHTTDGFTAAVLLLLVLTVAACTGGRGGPPPGPSSEEPPAQPLSRSIDAIRQITLRKGRLGWGGFEVGMTFRQAELVQGRRLPALAGADQDELCGYYRLETELMGQPVGLEWTEEAGESRLRSLWLPLQSRSGPSGRDEIVSALHARFPNLEHVPSPYEPDLSEESNPRPLYRLPEGEGMIFVQPGGVYIGEVCVD